MTNPIETAYSISTLFPLIPLEPHGKRPVLNSWQDPEARAAFDIRAHTGNIGGVIGEDHFVLDIDPRNGGGESFQQFKQDYPAFSMLYTASVLTAGGGAHFYLTLPPNHGRKITKSLEQYPGLDFLSGNRYVVLPGSVNGKGSWSWFNKPVTEPPLITQDILDALFKSDIEPQGGKLPAPDGLWGALTAEDLDRLLALLDVTSYAENDKWFELMAACHHASAGDGKEAFLEWSVTDPLYADLYSELEGRWDSLSDEGPGARPLTARSLLRHLKDAAPSWLKTKLNYQQTADLFKPIDATSAPAAPVKDNGPALAKERKEALDAWRCKIRGVDDEMTLIEEIWPMVAMDSRLTDVYINKLAKEIAKKADTTPRDLRSSLPPAPSSGDTPDGIDEDELHLSVVRGVIKRLGGEENLVYQAGDFWWYNGKHWEMKEDAGTQHLINRVTQDMGGNGILTGPFISSTSKVLQTYLDPKPVGYWNPEDKEVRINTTAGMLELDALGQWQVLPHHKSHRMNYCLPISPVEMPTPNFDRYMEEAVDGDEGTIRTLLAALVYTATSKKQWWKKCFFLHGETDTGKTVFLELLEAFIGNERRESLSMKDLGKEYALCNLRGKLLNSSGELDSSRIDVEIFKKLISGDSITANRKHQGHVQFNNNAIFWFAGNNWPNLRDESNASLNRITLIEFPNTKLPHEQDTMLGEKLKAELPGIFYRALRVFAEEYVKDMGMRIRETPEKSKRAFEEFRHRSQPIRLWAADRVEEDPSGAFITTMSLYQDYKSWTQNTSHSTMSESSFSARMPGVVGRKSERDKRTRGYRGVKLRSIFV